jgi:hypothetical protein
MGTDFELAPTRHVALRAYAVLSIVGLLSASALAMLLGTVAAKGVAGLIVHVIVWTTTVQLGMTAVFLDFYHSEKRTRWIVGDEGIRVIKPGTIELSVPWDAISWISPREHRLALAARAMTHPVSIYFVEPDLRDRVYSLYLINKVYPMASAEDREVDTAAAKRRAEPRGVIAYDHEDEEWNRRRR